jgi:type 1 glutamine amidotransferase
VHPERHPIAAPLDDFDLIDERYCYLRVDSEVVAFVSHEHENTDQPLAWARDHGTARIVVDALGHGVESYDSTEHHELILRSFQWLTRTPLTSPPATSNSSGGRM